MISTTNIQSLTIMATIRVYDELMLLLRSIYLFHPDIPIFILAQQAVCKKLRDEQRIPTNITLIPGMEEYGQHDWRDLPIKQVTRFLDSKTYAMQQALKKYANTLFMDTDMILTSPLGLVDDSKDIGLSLQIYSSPVYGRYSAGWVFVSNNAFLNWWSQKVANSSILFTEQLVLNEANAVFSSFLFPRTYNFVYRDYKFLKLTSRKYLHRTLHFGSGLNRSLTYRNQTIVSIHEHCFLPRTPNWLFFHLHQQLPVIFDEINHRRDKKLPYQVSQQDPLFFLFSFCFSRTRFRVYQIRWLGYIISNIKATPAKTIRRYWFIILKRILQLFLLPYYLWYLNQEIVYLYHLLVNKKNMITTRRFIGYTIWFTFLLLPSRIIKRIHRNRKT